MCFKCITNLAYATIILILFIILLILVSLIVTHPDRIKRPKCKIDEDNFGVCINSSLCAVDGSAYEEVDCSNGFTCCLVGDVIDESEKNFFKHKNFKFLDIENCGLIDESKNGIENKFRYVVDLGFENEDKEVMFFCGGSLIAANYVLTTAECVNTFGSAYNLSLIRLRHHEVCSENDCLDIREFKIIPHPQFDPLNLTDNIALIKFEKSFNFTSLKISPVCLPLNRNLEKIPKEMDGIADNNEIFKRNFVNLFNCHTSLNNLNKTVNTSKIEVKPLYEDSQFCVKNSDVNSTCHGLPGMPLEKSSLIKGRNRFVLYGISSYQFENCELPTVYTKVHGYLNWILDHIDS